ncbi:MAG: T9SS type A sorting domain-containing protein [Burkholderiales bacterium]|nr:T9SS type A sorting domain-containing protein [Bacteroidia bacterium]
MKKLLLFFSFISISVANAQNGFATYTTNLTITNLLKQQTAFLVDNAGNKWVGYKPVSTSNAGLVKYDNTTWTLFNTTNGLPSNSVTALANDNAGNIWIGTANAGLVKYDGANFTVYNISNGLPTNSITCIETSGSQVYIGTNAGMSRFDGISFNNYNLAGGSLPNDTIKCIKAETANLLWIGGNNRVVEFSFNGTFTSSSYLDHLVAPTAYGLPSYPLVSSGTINCIYIDAQNNKWLGTTTAGIIKYNGLVFKNAHELYELFGSLVPPKVIDITAGFHNGIIFKHAGNSGLTELASNDKVYQYFHLNPNYNFGDFLERDGTAILISKPIGNTSVVYSGFNSANYIMQLGAINVDNFKTLDINNVRAGIANRGDMHWDLGGVGNSFYEVPKGSGKNSNFASALWIGGLDNGGQLHGAAQTYRQGGVDFWPGPLDTISGTIDTATSVNYDKIWKVSYHDINTFVNAFNSGSVVATPDMLTWPAHGTGNNSKNLAPFVDHNGDGLYIPNDGDYPKIKGDQALYFIYNDMLAAHSTSFTPMGIEVHGMAYSYGCPAVTNGHNELTYTTFYDYKIINRSSTNYHDVFVSMWSDVDLGYYGDDYIGSNVADNYGYAYNGDAFDETIAGTGGYGAYMPAQGFNIVKGPLANTADGIDNNNNGTVDEPGEDCKLSKFNYFNNSFAGVPANTTDPVIGPEYYNVMNGNWKDGTALTCGGNGYGGSTPTNYVYTADSYTNGVCGSTPWYESGTPSDRRLIISSGPFTLNAGQMQEVEYAFVTSFDSSAAPSGSMSLAKLKTDIQKVNAFYNQVNKPNCLQAIDVGITEILNKNDFAVYPNPAKSVITISSNIIGNTKINYEVVDVLGKVILMNDNHNANNFNININDLNSGIYFLRLQINNSVVVKKFVKE